MRRLAAALGGALTIAAALPTAASAAPSVTEFSSGFTSGAAIHGMVAGPDGNLWTSDYANAAIDRVTPDGTVTVFSVSSKIGGPGAITTGPDGALWFVDEEDDQVGRMTTDGSLTDTYAISGSGQSIVTGPDGALWFTESDDGKIGRITTAGTVTEYPLPSTSSSPWEIAVGPDGKLWFTEHTNPGNVGTIDPVTHAIVEYPLGAGLGNDITAGPDGNMWLELGAAPGKIARIAPGGTGYVEWPTPTANATPFGVVDGGDGYLYFTEKTTGALGRISLAGDVEEFQSGTTAGLSASSSPRAIALGPDGNIWFAQGAPGKVIARLSIEPGVSTEPATGVSADAATIAARVRPSSQITTAYFEYGLTVSYGDTTAPAAVGSGTSRVALSALVTSLAPNTTYHYRVVATNPSGTRYGPDRTFTTPDAPPAAGAGAGDASDNTDDPATPTPAPATDPTTDPATRPAAPAPALGHTVVVTTGSGTVQVRSPGQARFAPLDDAAAIPVGSTIDARHGTVSLTSVRGEGGERQTAAFRGGLFQVRQRRSGVTDLYLRGGNARACRRGRPARRGSVTAAGSHRAYRRLWGRDHHGRFTTHGSHAIATVRGTEWTVADRCDGTVTRVARGKVSVRDLVHHRTVLVRAGRSYLAKVHR